MFGLDKQSWAVSHRPDNLYFKPESLVLFWRNPTVRKLLHHCLPALALVLLVGAARADELKVGDAAPSFESTDDQGKPFKSSDHVGKKVVVVYFFPAAMTLG